MRQLVLILITASLVGCGRRDESGGTKASPPPPSFSTQELQDFLTPGRTIAEVTNRLGTPSSVTKEDGRIVMTFAAVYDVLAMDPGQRQDRAIGSVTFTNGVVETAECLTSSLTVR